MQAKNKNGKIACKKLTFSVEIQSEDATTLMKIVLVHKQILVPLETQPFLIKYCSKSFVRWKQSKQI